MDLSNQGLSESIVYEIEPFGIKVILIEPGAIGSGFMKGSIMYNRALDPKCRWYWLVDYKDSTMR